MLRKQRARLVRVSATVAVTYGFAIYSIHKAIDNTNKMIENRYGIQSGTQEGTFQTLAQSGILDVRIHYLILTAAVLVFIYQTYKYFITIDSEEDLKREELQSKRQQEIAKERLQWKGVGQVSQVPKGLLVILGLMILLAGLYWFTF